MKDMAAVTAYRLGLRQFAGRCQGFLTDRHPNAPRGMSFCPSCNRTVCRGMGEWWK